MAELTIYDSQGNPHDKSSTGQRNERIKNLFFGGVRVYADVGSNPELIVFFRARKSNAGRAEQYYAVYRGRDSRYLFRNFKSDLQTRIEHEYGMEIDDSAKDTRVFGQLENGGGKVPGSDLDHDIVEDLLKKGQRLQIGVSDVDAALGVFSKYIQGPARTVAIAENTDINELSSCDLAIEIGNYRGFEPLGDTKAVINQERRRHEEQFIQQKVNSIKQDVHDIRTHTTANDEKIANELKRRLPIFKTPRRPQGTSGVLELLRERTRTQKLALGAVGIIVSLLVITLVGINTAAVVGISIPSQADPIVFANTSDDPFLDSIEINGNEFEDEHEISGQTINVTGETSEDEVWAKLEMNDEHSKNTTVKEGEFELILNVSQYDGGNGTLTIGVEDEAVESETTNVTVAVSSGTD